MTREMKDFFTFLREFLDVTNGQQEYTALTFPNVMQIIQRLAENDASIRQFFSGPIQDHKHKTLWTAETLREYFNEWAVISLEEGNHPERQE
jgi:CCR4-NOT transcription complex subunit 1